MFGASLPLLALGTVVPGAWPSMMGQQLVCPSLTEPFPILFVLLCPTSASRTVSPPREKPPGVSRTRTQHPPRVVQLIPVPPACSRPPAAMRCLDVACSAAEGWTWSGWTRLVPGPPCSCFHGSSASCSLCRPPQIPAEKRRVSFPDGCSAPAPQVCWLCTSVRLLGCFSMGDCAETVDVTCFGGWLCQG